VRTLGSARLKKAFTVTKHNRWLNLGGGPRNVTRTEHCLIRYRGVPSDARDPCCHADLAANSWSYWQFVVVHFFCLVFARCGECRAAGFERKRTAGLIPDRRPRTAPFLTWCGSDAGSIQPEVPEGINRGPSAIPFKLAKRGSAAKVSRPAAPTDPAHRACRATSMSRRDAGLKRCASAGRKARAR